MSAGTQGSRKISEIIAFAIIGDPHGAVRAAHGLMAGGREIDDRKPAMAERDAAAQGMSPIVGTAMRDKVRHPFEQAQIRLRSPTEFEDSGNAAHRLTARGHDTQQMPDSVGVGVLRQHVFVCLLDHPAPKTGIGKSFDYVVNVAEILPNGDVVAIRLEYAVVVAFQQDLASLGADRLEMA